MFFSIALSAQQPYSINYTDQDGLPSNEVYDIYQGSLGDLWIGTDLGLVRYDGQEFYSYYNEDAQSKSITAIFEDAQGRMWCLNFANQIFYIENDSLHLYKLWDEVKTKNTSVLDFRQARSAEEIIIETSRGLYITKHKEGKIPEHLPSDYFRYLNLPNSTYDLVLNKFHTSGINKAFTRDNDLLIEKIIDWKGLVTIENPKQAIYATSNLEQAFGNVYLINQKYLYAEEHYQKLSKITVPKITDLPHLYQLDMNGDSLILMKTPSQISQYGISLEISNYAFGSKEVVWLATNHGLFRWNFKTDKVDHYFEDVFCSSVLIDNEKNIWVSTLNRGLYFIPDIRIHSQDLKHDDQKITSLGLGANQKLLVGLENGKVEVYDGSVLEKLAYQQTLSFSLDRSVSIIHWDSIHYNSIIGSGLATYFIDSSLTKITKIDNITAVKDITIDNYGQTTFALGHGVFLFSSYANRQKPYLLDSAWLKTYNFHRHFLHLEPCCTRSYSILWQNKPEYQIWAGVYDNLYLFKKDGDTIITLPNGKPIIAKDIVDEEDGTVWIASSNHGLLKIVNEKVVEQISTREGLPDVYISKIVKDGNALWLATPKGIAKYMINQKKMVVYGKYYGVLNINITDMLILNNRLYFAGANQLMSLDTRINPEGIPAPIIRLDGTKINEQTIGLADLGELAPDENSLLVELSAITFRSQSSYRFKYRLYPLQQDWVYVESRANDIRYPKIPSGEYTFEAYAINRWGMESDESVKFDIKIAYPYYRRWWFIITVSLGSLAFVFFTFRQQLKRIQKRNQEKLERSQLERDLRISQLTALKAQMNPHFVFNVLNSIQGLYAIDAIKAANKQMSRFSKMIRLTLEYSNELSIPLLKELELLSLYLDIEKKRFEDHLNIAIKIDEELDTEAIKIPSLLIQPYVENAIKHGLLHKKGEQILSVEVGLAEEDILLVKIEDNGIGRQAAMLRKQQRNEYKSFATSANAKRLDLLNQERQEGSKIGIRYIDKIDAEKQALGTIVFIYIPIG